MIVTIYHIDYLNSLKLHYYHLFIVILIDLQVHSKIQFRVGKSTVSRSTPKFILINALVKRRSWEKKENPESDPRENHAKAPIIISLPFCSFNRAPVPQRYPTSFSRHSFDIQRRELAISVHWAPCCAPTLHARLRWIYAIAEKRIQNKKKGLTASEIEMTRSHKQISEFWETHLKNFKSISTINTKWKEFFTVLLACVYTYKLKLGL